MGRGRCVVESLLAYCLFRDRREGMAEEGKRSQEVWSPEKKVREEVNAGQGEEEDELGRREGKKG